MRTQLMLIHHEMQCAFCLDLDPETYQPVLMASSFDDGKNAQYVLVTDTERNWNQVDPARWSPRHQKEVEQILQTLLKVEVLRSSLDEKAITTAG